MMQHDLHKAINVLFIAGFGPVTATPSQSEALFQHILRLPLESIQGYEGYLHSQNIQGVKHFAVWPLDKAALSCFGTPEWPADVPVPQAWMELDVEDITVATAVLEDNGYALLTRLQEEPWGQTVTRFLSPEGLLLAVTFTPFLRDSSEG